MGHHGSARHRNRKIILGVFVAHHAKAPNSS
jgi:hypothetical protein